MSKKGSILFLHSSSELYGASKILIQVLEVVIDLGYSPLVILPGPGPLKEAISSLGIEVEIYNLAILRRKYFNFSGLFNRANRFWKAYKRLDTIIKERDIQLIYSNTLAVMVGAVYASKAKIPHVWHIHEIIQSPLIVTKLLSKIIDLSTSRPIAVSDAVRDHWKKYLKKSSPEVIYNGIDYLPYVHEFDVKRHEFLALPKGKIIVTMIGRINPGKGQLFFLEIAKKLTERHGRKVHFLMVGDAYPGYEFIDHQIEEFILDHLPPNQVTKLAFRNDIPQILNASDVFVMPSILPDSFPTVILEAMAAGLPIVATKSGGASEMVEDGVSGFLIPIKDVELGVEKISILIKNEGLAKTMGQFARSQVQQQYNLEAFNNNIKRYLCQIIKP